MRARLCVRVRERCRHHCHRAASSTPPSASPTAAMPAAVSTVGGGVGILALVPWEVMLALPFMAVLALVMVAVLPLFSSKSGHRRAWRAPTDRARTDTNCSYRPTGVKMLRSPLAASAWDSATMPIATKGLPSAAALAARCAHSSFPNLVPPRPWQLQSPPRGDALLRVLPLKPAGQP